MKFTFALLTLFCSAPLAAQDTTVTVTAPAVITINVLAVPTAPFIQTSLAFNRWPTVADTAGMAAAGSPPCRS